MSIRYGKFRCCICCCPYRRIARDIMNLNKGKNKEDETKVIVVNPPQRVPYQPIGGQNNIGPQLNNQQCSPKQNMMYPINNNNYYNNNIYGNNAYNNSNNNNNLYQYPYPYQNYIQNRPVMH